jgi:hypothetical protein
MASGPAPTLTRNVFFMKLYHASVELRPPCATLVFLGQSRPHFNNRTGTGARVSQTNAKFVQISSDCIFPTLLRATSWAIVAQQFAKHDAAGNAVLFHAREMPEPTQSAAADHHLNRERICTLPHLLIGHSTVPLDSQNTAQTPMYKSIHPLQVGLLKCHGLNPIQQGR